MVRGVGVPGGVLYVAQGHAGVEGQGDERMAQAVGAEPLGAVQAGGPGEAAHQAERCRFVVATAAAGDEQRASVPPGEVVVEGPSGDRGEHDCRSPAAFAGDVQHPAASLGAEVGGVGRQRLTDAQAVVGEQGEQGQVPAALAGAGGGPLPGEGEHGPELVTVEPGGLAVVSDFGPAHAGDRRPATGDRSMRSSSVA